MTQSGRSSNGYTILHTEVQFYQDSPLPNKLKHVHTQTCKWMSKEEVLEDFGDSLWSCTQTALNIVEQ